MKASRSGSVKRDTASRSSTSSARSKCRFCRCGEELLMLTSNTANNPGRLFWRCPNWGTRRTCNYFMWVDEDANTQSRSVIHEDEQEEEMKRKNEEVDELRRKNFELLNKVADERKKGNLFMGLFLVTWVVTIGLCLMYVLKCGCHG